MGFNDLYRFSVHAVILKDGKVLLLKQTYGDKRWGLPGGGVEPGETVHEAISRECKEELGVDVVIDCFTGLYYHMCYNAQVGIFRCSLPETACIKLSDEHSEYGWFDPDELGEVQKRRVLDAIEYDGKLFSRSF